MGLFTVEKCTRLKDAVCRPLGEAITATNSGVLVIGKGWYSGRGTCGGIVDNQRKVTIEAPDGVENTVIDCSEDAVRHFEVGEGSTLVIRGVTLMNGGSDSVSQGGCVRVTGRGAVVSLFDVVLTGCIAQYGGAVYASSGATVMIGMRSVLRDNTAVEEGGCLWGMYVSYVCIYVCVCMYACVRC
jgi:hypothetical protein